MATRQAVNVRGSDACGPERNWPAPMSAIFRDHGGGIALIRWKSRINTISGMTPPQRRANFADRPQPQLRSFQPARFFVRLICRLPIFGTARHCDYGRSG